MKYTVAWANVLSQNLILKISVVVLLLSTLIFSLTTVKLAVREPVIIDRECYSRVAGPADSKHTAAEMEQFVRLAISKRFDTDALEFRNQLSEEEAQFRLKEQEDLAKKGVVQRVKVTTAKIDGAIAMVEADRILAVGKVRSALYFPLKVTLATTTRTASNPYGLLLLKVSQVPMEPSK